MSDPKVFDRASRKKKRIPPRMLQSVQDSHQGSGACGERKILERLAEARYAPHTAEGTILGELKKLLKHLPKEVKIGKTSFKVVDPGKSRVKVEAKLRVLKGVDLKRAEALITQGLDKVQGTQMGPGNEIMFDISPDLKTVTFEKYHL